MYLVLLLKKCVQSCGEVKNFVEMYHPDKAVASRVSNLFNDIAISHFRNNVKQRRKQVSIERFLVKKRPSESQAKSASKKQTIQEMGDSPSKQ